MKEVDLFWLNENKRVFFRWNEKTFIRIQTFVEDLIVFVFLIDETFVFSRRVTHNVIAENYNLVW